MIANGHYEPNEAGAATLRDAKPLRVSGDKVTADVLVREGVQQVSVSVGRQMVFEGGMPAGVTGYDEFYAWVRKTATTVSVRAEKNGGLVHVTAYVPYRASVRSANSKAAWAARKLTGGRVARVASEAWFHGNGAITYTYTYARFGTA